MVKVTAVKTKTSLWVVNEFLCLLSNGIVRFWPKFGMTVLDIAMLFNIYTFFKNRHRAGRSLSLGG
jgi:hypothetical protein